MKRYPVAIFCDTPEVNFEYRIVSHMARVSVDFIITCEREELVTAHTMFHGAKGLTQADVRKLSSFATCIRICDWPLMR